jgi:hypothetical protein
MIIDAAAVSQRLSLLECTAQAFAAIWGKRSASYVSAYLRGCQEMDSEDIHSMLDTLREMESLAAAVKPLPINWSRAAQVGMTLDICRARKDFAAGVLALGLQ